MCLRRRSSRGGSGRRVGEGAAVAVRVAGRVWAGVAVGAAAVWAGVRAAVWFPGVCGAAAGCWLRGQVLILLSPCCPCLLLPAEAPCVSPWPPPSVCVFGGDPWGHGGHCHICPGSSSATASGSSLRGATREQTVRPHGRGPGGPGGRDPQPPGGGAAARPLCSLLFGALRLPLSPSSRPECQTGGGDEPTTPPSLPMETSGVGIRPLPPPGAGLGELWGALGADSSALSRSPPPPRLTRPPPAPLESGREWRAHR